MRTPKAPAGFVPVDSEEARKIDNEAYVNVAYVVDDAWHMRHMRMRACIELNGKSRCFDHVQLPPPVEWEEVWGWESHSDGIYIIKNGKGYTRLNRELWTEQQADTIVRALNEMEGRDG